MTTIRIEQINSKAVSEFLANARHFDSGAEISECGKYRYFLFRDWKDGPITWNAQERGRLTFVMLNPSTADGNQNDPTIRRCMAWAYLLGYAGIEVVNVMAYRATDPRELAEASAAHIDICGPENERYLFAKRKQAVIAWGGSYRFNEAAVISGLKDVTQTLWCFGKTKSGAPKHPLYLSYKTPLEVYK